MACTETCGLGWLSCLQIPLILLVTGAWPLENGEMIVWFQPLVSVSFVF